MYSTVHDIVLITMHLLYYRKVCGCFTLHSVLYDGSRVGCNKIVIIHNITVRCYCCFIYFINVSLFVWMCSI